MTIAGPRPVELPELVRPAYGRSTLGDLLPGVAHQLGVLGFDDNPLDVPASERYVVLLVDGLGWNLVRRAIRDAPYLASLLGDAQCITSGVPSTTVTSLTSLGTGLPPGRHGMVGYTCRVPSTGEILNALTWESDLVARAFQPHATVFERLAGSGVSVSSVALERFASSGLTEASLRGPAFVPIVDESDEDAWVDLTVRSARRGRRSVVYAYERQLDHTGHTLGCGSADWLAHLTRIDALCERLRDALPPDVRLLITGDHGMVDVPQSGQLVVEDEPGLLDGVSALAGEGRFRQLYVDHADPRAVAERWRDRLGDTAWVRTRDEAIDDGWFGPVDDQVRERYGHVIIATRTDIAVMTRAFGRELSLVGMHGSLTPDEMLVPLFVD